jgi:hypothetical protein
VEAKNFDPLEGESGIVVARGWKGNGGGEEDRQWLVYGHKNTVR